MKAKKNVTRDYVGEYLEYMRDRENRFNLNADTWGETSENFFSLNDSYIGEQSTKEYNHSFEESKLSDIWDF